jgi:hypothetical protein
VAPVLDLEVGRLEKTCSTLSDADLVFVMLGLLQPSISGHPVTAGASVTAGKCARVAFTEIAQRWIPLDVFADAFGRVLDEHEEADDA